MVNFHQLFFEWAGLLYNLVIDSLDLMMVYLIKPFRKAQSVTHLDQQKK